ncbi:S-layer homology domain-containing protein [Brevibacillus reuszeri]
MRTGFWDSASFGDLQGVEEWAGDNVRELAGLGIIKGVVENQISPMK